MLSKMVTNRLRKAAQVEAAVKMHGGLAAEAVEEDLRLLMEEGDAPPAVLEMLRLLGRKLARARQVLEAADGAHRLELDDDAAPRRLRDAAAREVYFAVSRLRAVFRGLYGIAVATELLGVGGRTAEDPLVLHSQAQRILKRFTAPDLRLPEFEVAGMGMEPEACVARLRPSVDRLGLALREVNRQRRAAEATLKAKTEALRDYDRTYQGVAKTLEGLLTLAGLEELARRVRPTQRKASRRENVAPEVSSAPVSDAATASFSRLPLSPLTWPLTIPVPFSPESAPASFIESPLPPLLP